MLTVKVEGLQDCIRQFQEMPAAIQRASIIAMNWTAQQAHDAVVKTMPQVFHQPTPWTMKGFYVWRADKNNPSATLEARQFAGKGTPAQKYLEPEVYGGDRRAKRHERALRAAGILPGNMFTVPASRAPLDPHGNLRGSEYVRILSELKAFGEVGYLANITARSAARKQKSGRMRNYFAIKPGRPVGGAREPGVYRRVGGSIRPILFFTNRPTYTPRLHFDEIARRTIDANFANNFNLALGYEFR